MFGSRRKGFVEFVALSRKHSKERKSKPRPTHCHLYLRVCVWLFAYVVETCKQTLYIQTGKMRPQTRTTPGGRNAGGDFFNNVGNPFGRISSIDKLWDTAPLDSKQKSHLKNVYSLLTVGVLFAAVGSYFHLVYNIGGLLTMFASLGMIFYLAMSQVGSLFLCGFFFAVLLSLLSLVLGRRILAMKT